MRSSTQQLKGKKTPQQLKGKTNTSTIEGEKKHPQSDLEVHEDREGRPPELPVDKLRVRPAVGAADKLVVGRRRVAERHLQRVRAKHKAHARRLSLVWVRRVCVWASEKRA